MAGHNFSIWREVIRGDEAPVGPLWIKCKCGWSEHGTTYDELSRAGAEHRAEVTFLEELEREEARHG